MKGRKVLILGCGDIGIRLGTALVESGARVHGVRRDTARLPATFTGHAADYTQPDSLGFIEALAPDYVVATLNPFDRSLDGYRSGFTGGMAHLLQGLGSHRPRHVVMSSSTRVFAERDGGWVDESSPLTTEDPFAAAIIAAESLLLDSGLGASVVRFGGVYGVPGGRLVARISRGEICPPEPIRFTNRIHREDCAGFIGHLLARAERGEALEPVYIGVDDDPAPRYEVESWLARRLGVAPGEPSLEPPLEPPFEPTRHNGSGHKRCRNRALRESGYALVYPDYRAGYGALLD